MRSHVVTGLGTKAYTPAPRVTAVAHKGQALELWRWRIVALLRVLCGSLCLGDAWLKWRGSFTDGYLSLLSHAAGGHIPLVSTWFSWWLGVAQLQTQAFIAITLLAEICLGICLICGVFTTLSCLMGMFLTALGSMGMGLLTGFFGQGSPDIGVLVVFWLTFLGLMLSRAGRYAGLGPDKVSL
ncbi:hypothetical protein KDH_12900 [Dictyobacter sp. S3.2.2.5]|uniref:DoxX family protein n=2 Tax=Dictyobacter halimunensis TaxID=3026934 RepID=A0ABQ6FPT7_9CHLR|nr:hypothetical protein KDH_12900 [Dictyobacter sp. S3.2.2.5]